MLTLVTGGARSGKSSFAQSLCHDGARVVYIATATVTDGEMRERIRKHQNHRPVSWITIEEPIAVSHVVARHAPDADFVLIDCLTLWLSNLLYESRHLGADAMEAHVQSHVHQLIEASSQGNIIAVTNEVGSGIVPESPVARQFRDLQGFVNQQIARAAQTVYLLTSGIPLRIKPNGGSL